MTTKYEPTDEEDVKGKDADVGVFSWD